MGCQHLDELHELWLLGALTEQASRELSEHLARGCPHCLTRIRDATGMVYLLALGAKPARPHPRVKSELLRKISHKMSTRG